MQGWDLGSHIFLLAVSAPGRREGETLVWRWPLCCYHHVSLTQARVLSGNYYDSRKPSLASHLATHDFWIPNSDISYFPDFFPLVTLLYKYLKVIVHSHIFRCLKIQSLPEVELGILQLEMICLRKVTLTTMTSFKLCRMASLRYRSVPSYVQRPQRVCPVNSVNRITRSFNFKTAKECQCHVYWQLRKSGHETVKGNWSTLLQERHR